MTRPGLFDWPTLLPRLLAARYTSGLLSAFVAVIIFVFAGLTIWQNREAAFKERQRGLHSVGVVLAEQTARYVQVIDLTLQDVAARVARMGIATPAEFETRLSKPDFQAYLAEHAKSVPQADAFVIVNAEGHLVNTSRPGPLQRIDASARDYFQYFQSHDDRGLFIGSLSRGLSTGKLNLFFARRINGADGMFHGVVLSVVDIQYLNDFYHSASQHMGEAVSLLRRNGTMLMRYPDPFAAIGVSLPEQSPWYRIVGEGGGSYVTAGVLDGTPSLVSVPPLRDYPLVVDILLETKNLYAVWRSQTIYIVCLAVVAAMSFAGLFWVLARQLRRQAEQNVELEEATRRLAEGQQKLRSFAEMSADWFWEQDTNFRFKFDSSIPFMVASDDTGKSRREIGDPAMSEERWARHEADLQARVPFRDFRWERIGSDGLRHFMSTNGDPIFDHNGAFAGYRGTGRDITAAVEGQARLLQANDELEIGRRRFDAVLNNITQGVGFFDGEQRLLLWNRRYMEIYNLPPEAARIGCPWSEIVAHRIKARTVPVMSPPDLERWQTAIATMVPPDDGVVELRDGRFIAVNHQVMAGGGWVATHEDVTIRHQAEARIVFMARHDALTKLPNRAMFQERMEQAMAMAARGTQSAVMCLDLDNFKKVNDTLGHPVGDGLLVAVADRLRGCVRDGDTVARVGGDEFAIIQLAVQQPDDAEILASRIAAAFAQPFDVGGHQIMSGVSIGVTVAPRDGVSYETLMRDADIALYLAKAEGRATTRFFEPEMDSRIHLRRVLELDLQDSVARNEFELHYQPLICLKRNKVSGFEALLRWRHPVRGMVSPLDFIPVAEETGMILAIGAWALQAACLEAAKWPSGITVAVNLSPIQFKKGDLVATVEAALAASGLRPERLELEITESVFLRDTADTLAALRQLRAMGIGVALDDFGTGYSSLSYLRSFPFSKIKIDQSFVRDVITNKESMSIIRAVIGLGQSLGIRTIAEGVETRDQLEWLQDEGCTEVQGYFFSRPRPAGEVPWLIDRLQNIGSDSDFAADALL